MSEFVGFKLGKLHESHVISEYYCGGCGWPVADHDSFCPECGGAFRESDADDSLQAENAELRKLVSVLVHCLDDTDGCDTCPINGNPYDVSTIWGACDTLRDMLRDAGFEVGE